MNVIENLKEYLRINAIKRLFSFVEVRRSEVIGLVVFASVFALLEGLGISLLLPILQFAETGSTVLSKDSTGYWRIFHDALIFVGLKPSLMVLLILAFIPILLRNALFYLRTWYSAIVTSRIMLRLRMKVVDVIYDADPEFYTRHPVGQLVGVVMGQTSAAGGAVLSVINLLGIIFLGLVYIAILLILSVPLTFSALLFAALVALINKRVLRWIGENSLKNARLGQELMGKITERMGQMQLVKLRHTKDQESENIRNTSEVMRDLGIKASLVGASIEVIVDPVLMLSVFVTLYIGIAILGSTLAQLGLLLFILNRLNAKVKEFNGALQSISGGRR